MRYHSNNVYFFTIDVMKGNRHLKLNTFLNSFSFDLLSSANISVIYHFASLFIKFKSRLTLCNESNNESYRWPPV